MRVLRKTDILKTDLSFLVVSEVIFRLIWATLDVSVDPIKSLGFNYLQPEGLIWKETEYLQLSWSLKELSSAQPLLGQG